MIKKTKVEYKNDWLGGTFLKVLNVIMKEACVEGGGGCEVNINKHEKKAAGQ